MSRLSRDQQREPQRQDPVAGAGGQPVPGESPIEVRVPASAADAASAETAPGDALVVATADGGPVTARPGEPVQAAILRHLHRLALAAGRPVLASVHDERIGFVVPLQVSVDGSSRYAGEPVRTSTGPEGKPPRPAGAAPAPQPQPGSQPEPEPESESGPESGPESGSQSGSQPVPAPLGQFGPAPVMDPVMELPSAPAPKPSAAPAVEALSLLASGREPDPKPTPARGFDAVAEEMLAPDPDLHSDPGASAPGRGGTTAFYAEPVARINDAVRRGRIDEAAGTAERTVAAAAQALGEEHPEVLKLRELTSYIAYLAGDALRSFHLSLDLARVRRRHGDADGAYGNVQSAATAWRAVRDPLQGLHLGRDLITVWTELAADGGPAADDVGQLESARTRMGRLTERARALNE